MRLFSKITGITVGFVASVLTLVIIGGSGEAIHLLFLLLAIAIGIGVGVMTARQVERREDRLARNNPTS